ncbi:MAG: hypothetical protein GY710_23285 [Desulfobacteraceae bacterium]|nr:hypothetical protein [Desulfobacteraceae bacterium]
MFESGKALAKVPHGREWNFKQSVGGHGGILRESYQIILEKGDNLLDTYRFLPGALRNQV